MIFAVFTPRMIISRWLIDLIAADIRRRCIGCDRNSRLLDGRKLALCPRGTVRLVADGLTGLGVAGLRLGQHTLHHPGGDLPRLHARQDPAPEDACSGGDTFGRKVEVGKRKNIDCSGVWAGP